MHGHSPSVTSFPRMGNALSLIRLALTEFLNNLHTTPNSPSTHTASQASHSQIPAVHSGPTHLRPSLPTFPSSRHMLILSLLARVSLGRRSYVGSERCVFWGDCRNGGHISPPLYHDYTSLKRDHGQPVAQKMMKLRLAHLEELRSVAEQEGILAESQWREVESVDVFYNSDMFEKAKTKVQTYKADLPFDAKHHEVYEAKEAIEKYRLASDTLDSHSAPTHHAPPSHLQHPPTPTTPSPLPAGSSQPRTSSMQTNGWASTLLEKFRGKIIPFRGNMSAQRPGQSIPLPDSNPTSHRSFIFYTRPIGYDYLTQLPTGEHELMLGGGFAQDGDEGYEAMGNTDDTTYSKRIGAHLSGVLPRYFGEDNWGKEGVPLEGGEGEWAGGRVKALWSGILGISADLIPWVGRLPRVASGRSEPPLSSVVKSEKEGVGERVHVGAAPGEWIAAGYSGEGMVHAWLSGKALTEMMLGREVEGRLGEWFPDIMRVTEKRWKKAKAENLLDALDDD
ncbi:FAD dependent oxidoreductase [Suillus lakei]|nr:FAD dependent oxidoreductase [Suillus lakei]